MNQFFFFFFTGSKLKAAIAELSASNGNSAPVPSKPPPVDKLESNHSRSLGKIQKSNPITPFYIFLQFS
jgi:hypothetical protein